MRSYESADKQNAMAIASWPFPFSDKMHPNARPLPRADDYSVVEIARAAGVRASRARRAIADELPGHTRGPIAREDAVRIVRLLTGRATPRERAPLRLIAETCPRRGLPLAISSTLHALVFLALIVMSSLGLIRASDADRRVPITPVTHLVFLMTPGPGGGGGGGGLHAPTPPPRAERAAPVARKVSSPVPPVIRRVPPPTPPKPVVAPPVPPPPVPKPVERPVPPPPVVPPKPAPAAVQAPVVPIASDPIDKPGLPSDSPASAPSQGPGSGGGIGSGAGTGLGSGHDGGIGDGSGGGTGGGAFGPGNGIAPPSLVREVKADYTDDARRRAVEGSVVLEIVVRRDGSVGSVRLVHGLDTGLDRKATDAVRQWRFAPATRSGAAVDVVVEVSVDFKLR